MAVERGAGVLPGKGRNGGQVWVVLDRIAGEERRKVRAFGLQEGGQVGRAATSSDVDVQSTREEHDVRQVVAGHDRSQLGRVVDRLDHVELHVGVQLLVDLLPGRVLLERGGRRIEAVAQRGDDTALAGRLPGPGLDGVGRVVVPAVLVLLAGAGVIGLGSVLQRDEAGQDARRRGAAGGSSGGRWTGRWRRGGAGREQARRQGGAGRERLEQGAPRAIEVERLVVQSHERLSPNLAWRPG